VESRPAEDVGKKVRAAALAEGFDFVRFAPAAPMLAARDAANTALADGRLADMAWMTAAWIERAADPERFLAGARSVVAVGMVYGRSPAQPSAGAVSRGRVAAYATGRDYHRVFEPKLRRLCRVLRDDFGASARAAVDYGPLLERPLAALAGIGWQGKSTMLLVPGAGPWVLLGMVATSLELPADAPLRKSCGTCTRCITACPTGAISADGGELDARLCISYHTIESRGVIPRELRAKFGAWIFGCDACLDSCPVGAQRPGAADGDEAWPELAPLLALDEVAFRAKYRGRAITRAKRDGFLRNVCVALGNVGGEADVPALVRALSDPAPLVRGHAAWALGELARRLPGTRARTRAALDAQLAVEDDAWVREELAAAPSPPTPLPAAAGRGEVANAP
jgi:epoxyqueuosine reductase